MYRNGKRLWPRDGVMMVEDETGRRFDLMVYYRDHEYEPFPMPDTDDGLDSDALLMAPDDLKRNVWQLEFPESDEEAAMREMAAMRQMSRSQRYETGQSDPGAWMEKGL
jgi:hypothetical protein